MSVEYFISKRILKNEVSGKKVSKAIVRISIISIALAVVVNLITIAVVTGFQKQVRDKVTGFGSHLFILSASQGSIYESEPIHKNQTFLNELRKTQGVKGVFPVAYKPVLFQSEASETRIRLADGNDSTVNRQDVQGALIKGVDEHYDWSFFKNHIISGKIPSFDTDASSNELLISKKIADDLHYKLGDTVRAFFVRSAPIMRFFVISGIYETGLEEHDKKMALGDLRVVQELNDWGITTAITIDDTLFKTPGYNDRLIIRANATGGHGQFRYDWGEGYGKYSANLYGGFSDTSYKVVVSDFYANIDGRNEQPTLPDSAELRISVQGNVDAMNQFEVNELGELVRHYSDDTGLRYTIKSGEKTFLFEHINGSGTFNNYVGGFEISISNWHQLEYLTKSIKKQIEFIPTTHGESLKVASITDTENDIFVWLGFLDLNVLIILTLMILIGIINMGSALLVLILIRTNFIGILKSMGATNWSIRKIFLTQASFLILRGMLIGNVIGLGICALQYYLNIIPLDPKVYYLSTVPIDLSFWSWLFLNIATLIVCVTALIVPSIVITRISPVKAIRFN